MSHRPSHITLEASCDLARTFRVDRMAGKFDVPIADQVQFQKTVEVPELEATDWRIGAIIGPSGSGKGKLAKALFRGAFLEQTPDRTTPFDWPADATILDAFPADMEEERIANALTAVGFSSTPDWFKPYRVLSTGQRFRADLARALLCPGATIGELPGVAVDEFGGTVSEQVACIAAAAVAKAVRRGRVPVKRFVAVGCRDSFVPWLEPDWVVDMATGTCVTRPAAGEPVSGDQSGDPAARGSLPQASRLTPQGCWFAGRPAIQLQVRLAHRACWPLYREHHYLSHQLHKAARCYLAWWTPEAPPPAARATGDPWPVTGDPDSDPVTAHGSPLTPSAIPVAFLATLQTTGKAGRRMAHRLVVLPDYQGLGIGIRFLEAVARYELAHVKQADRPIRSWGIITSHPALIYGLRSKPTWRCYELNRATGFNSGLLSTRQDAARTHALPEQLTRFRASFRYVG